METITYQNNSFTLNVYQTDDLRKWIGIYLHACRSRNLAAGTIEFYDKKISAAQSISMYMKTIMEWGKVSIASRTGSLDFDLH
jgi:hypothetical protein